MVRLGMIFLAPWTEWLTGSRPMPLCCSSSTCSISLTFYTVSISDASFSSTTCSTIEPFSVWIFCAAASSPRGPVQLRQVSGTRAVMSIETDTFCGDTFGENKYKKAVAAACFFGLFHLLDFCGCCCCSASSLLFRLQSKGTRSGGQCLARFAGHILGIEFIRSKSSSHN